VYSDTAAMSDLYENLDRELQGVEGSFAVQPAQVGAVFILGGQVAGLEIFDAHEAFARGFAKTLRAYAVEMPTAAPLQGQALEEDLYRFLADLVSAKREQYPALGEGQDLRLTGVGVSGGALVSGERVVHLAAYRRPPQA